MPRFIASRLLCLVSVLYCASSANAASITPFAGQHFGSSFDTQADENTNESVELSDESSVGLLLTWDYDPGRETEILISHSQQDLEISTSTSLDEEIETDVTYFHFGGRVWYRQDKAIQTSLSGGIGASYFDAADDAFDSELKASVHLGLGAKYMISEKLAIRGDVRVYGTFFDSDHSVQCEQGTCLVHLKSELYIQTEVAVGLEFRF